ncbi:MAG: hypothetical protein GAK31_03337 [Stenotrophomonas maltophilia]|uniref:Uncharacterized protein n=1 Tax=Stenotrophomonas maltophilia TaxID=40324 RepID=A0A7V8JKA2_STEMA|nr:MAG: hypothetical protein GAK31_03337 [Stenotrophomonas maltophilia]
MPRLPVLSDDEAVGLLNALNYFGHALDADTCQTLTGLAQAQMQALHARLQEALIDPPPR